MEKVQVRVNHVFNYANKTRYPGDLLLVEKHHADYWSKLASPPAVLTGTKKNVAETYASKHIGGGMYEISKNGNVIDRVKGRKEANNLIDKLQGN